MQASNDGFGSSLPNASENHPDIVFGRRPQSSPDIDTKLRRWFGLFFLGVMASHLRFGKFNDICRRFAGHYRLNMPRPCRHGGALLVSERMPLIDANNS